MVRGLFDFIKNQPVRAFALLCVAITSGFIMFMRYWQFEVLASSDWCARALKAEQITGDSRFDALKACIDLQKIQINSIAVNSYIDGGTIALCLLALMVIVVAGGHISFTGSKAGVGLNLGADKVENAPEVRAADKVATAAVDEAVAVREEVAAHTEGEAAELPDYAR